ncbi:MAG: hypothetical protein LBC63_00505 [Holophagales bacterium]|nr:hypothetical protein [Holophagales bacterium]
MIPFELMPGAKHWMPSLPKLAVHSGPIWVYGPSGCGASTLANWLAAQRGAAAIESSASMDLDAWLKDNPLGSVASNRAPNPKSLCEIFNFALLELWPLDDDPESIHGCLQHLALDEGLKPPLPSELAALPCNGNFQELRNRIRRWHLLGELPEPNEPKLLEPEDIATNLHVLERTLLHRALRRSYGNRAEAAARLGICRRQLYLLIGRHGDPVRGQPPGSAAPKRLEKMRHNSISPYRP